MRKVHRESAKDSLAVVFGHPLSASVIRTAAAGYELS